MTYKSLYLAPGVRLTDSPYSLEQPFAFVNGRYAQGRYVNGNLYRFTAGFPEKLGGWISQITSGIKGIPRCLKVWRDYTGTPELGIGTETHLYAWTNNTLTDITPLRMTVNKNLTNALSTVGGSPVITVADTTATVMTGDWVIILAGSTVGGVLIYGAYIVQTATPGTGYTIDNNVVSVSTASGGGGTTQVQYPRVTLTNPFATTSGSNVVVVTDPTNASLTGDFVNFSGATAYNGITLNGQYQLTVLTGNTYSVVAANAATGTGAAGGGTVSATHNVTMTQVSIGNLSTFGQGGYGLGPYGYQAIASSSVYPGWTLAPYGTLLLANNIGGSIYCYDPSQGGVAFPLVGAPSGVQAMFVTPERFVVALGTNQSTLQIAWCDQANFNNWTSNATDTANSGRTLQGGATFIGGSPVAGGTSLILTDRCAFVMSYTGDAYVYNTPMIADNAGLIGPNAVVAEGEVAYWMSDKDFWMFNGAATPLGTDDIRDFVYRNLNPLYKTKCCAGFNRIKKEVWFFWVSNSSTEIDSYVIYHTDQQCFSTGTLSRTAWVDSTLFANPYAADATGVIYQHESGVDANGAAMESWIQTNPIDLSSGDVNLDINGLIPDTERQSGNVNVTVLTQYYPNDTPVANGPFTMAADDTTPIIDMRLDGKMVALQFQSNVIGGDYRLGMMRIDMKPSGARR